MKNLAIWLSNNRFLRPLFAWNVSFIATPALWDLSFMCDWVGRELYVSIGPIDFQYTAWKLLGEYSIVNDEICFTIKGEDDEPSQQD